MKNYNETAATLKMIADYMENGFLENIVDMFKQDQSYYALIGALLGDERSRVRIGTVALVEILKTIDPVNLHTAIPGIAKLLDHENVTIRGDAAYMFGIIGHKDALPFLAKAATDENELVRDAVEEAVREIKKGDGELG